VISIRVSSAYVVHSMPHRGPVVVDLSLPRRELSRVLTENVEELGSPWRACQLAHPGGEKEQVLFCARALGCANVAGADVSRDSASRLKGMSLSGPGFRMGTARVDTRV
jgi:hypothetical protein